MPVGQFNCGVDGLGPSAELFADMPVTALRADARRDQTPHAGQAREFARLASIATAGVVSSASAS